MPHPVDVHVGQRLKQIRTLRHLSETDVARGLDVSPQQIQKYEIGSNRLAASRLYELSRLLDVPTSYFFEGAEASETPAKRDSSMEIIDALAAIKDDTIKARIVTFIQDASGVTAAGKE